jgi:hypothetical protein
MLLETHRRLPSERLGEAFGVNIVAAGKLQVREEPLQLIGDAVFLIPVQVCIVLPGVDELAEVVVHVQRLQQTVHIAGRPLVGQADILVLPLFGS